jgi:hypothetical protein
LLLLLLLEDFSEEESPLGELSFEVECDAECSWFVFIGSATTIGAGATTTGAG